MNSTHEGWFCVNTQKPKVGKKVLVCGHYSNGNRWIALARWQPAGTIDAEPWDETPDDWWNEDGNVCTNPQDVWLEESVELETTGFLENVTHWMHIPALLNAKKDGELKLEGDLDGLEQERDEARRIAEAYRDVWEMCTAAVETCPNPDPLPWKKEDSAPSADQAQ